MAHSSIVVLGGGQAAANAIKGIRSIDAKSPVSLVSEENYLPYERPPLSKKYILGTKTLDSCEFFPSDFYSGNDVALFLGSKVTNVDLATHRLEFEDRASLPFDKLVIATGSKNRRLQIRDLPDDAVLYLRNRDDAERIVEKAKASRHIVIIGGGFIGLELAASLTSIQKHITVIEASNRLMSRSIPTEISSLIGQKHEERGVEFRLDTKVVSGAVDNSRYSLELSDGSQLSCDMVIGGVGVEPNLDAMDNKLIEKENGIRTDEYGKTSVEGVYAAGDVANFWHPLYESFIRLESFKHAQNHGINSGKNAVGANLIYDDVPWMWSDQYDLNIQLSGIVSNYDECVSRGDSLVDGLIYFYLKKGIIKGACGVSVGPKIGRVIRASGMLSASKIVVDIDILKNPKSNLKELFPN
tara:strand:- start:9860 stop:11095 length:1236 start_codon:yes stop_codon:yes gene_type:complete